MLPLGHFLVAALPLTVLRVARDRRPPPGHVLLVVLVATQVPDAIDKPLAWTLGVIPSGRMVAHSIVLAVPALAVVVGTARRVGRPRLGVLFAAAYLSHLAGDFYPVLSEGTGYYFWPNLFWPLLAARADEAASFGAHAPGLVSLVLTLGLFGAVTVHGLADGYRRYRDGRLFRPGAART